MSWQLLGLCMFGAFIPIYYRQPNQWLSFPKRLSDYLGKWGPVAEIFSCVMVGGILVYFIAEPQNFRQAVVAGVAWPLVVDGLLVRYDERKKGRGSERTKQ